MTPSNIAHFNPAPALGAAQSSTVRKEVFGELGSRRGVRRCLGCREQAAYSTVCVFSLQGNVDSIVRDVVERILTADAGSSWKAVSPKALLDNCFKVMRMLYSLPCE